MCHHLVMIPVIPLLCQPASQSFLQGICWKQLSVLRMADAGTPNSEQERAGSAEGDGSDEEDHGNKLVGKPQLVVDDDLREMAKTAAWSVSSYKPGSGVLSLRDGNLDTYWQ